MRAPDSRTTRNPSRCLPTVFAEPILGQDWIAGQRDDQAKDTDDKQEGLGHRHREPEKGATTAIVSTKSISFAHTRVQKGAGIERHGGQIGFDQHDWIAELPQRDVDGVPVLHAFGDVAPDLHLDLRAHIRARREPVERAGDVVVYRFM